MTLEEVLSVRPAPGVPRPYAFPSFVRTILPSGLEVLTVHVPGRPLVAANLVIGLGAASEPAEAGGATVLAARALTEGSTRHPGLELLEAAERLGATLHAEAGWDAFAAAVDVPASRLDAALGLLAELVEEPAFPAEEVSRLRDERLNDLLQARADPRRRADDAFNAAIYQPHSPYSRPAAGREQTVAGLDRDTLGAVHRQLLSAPRMALVIGGDLTGLDVAAMAGELLARLPRSDAAGDAAGTSGEGQPAGPAAESVPATGQPAPSARATGAIDGSAIDRTFVRLIHRPGSVQSEIRIGHVGARRRSPDFHAIQVMAAILGGLFNSRLNMNLREDKGYTYSAHAGFDMRRDAGPFAARTAVNTEATVPSVAETLNELRRIREAPVSDRELAAARDYLVGVFPLRFETPEAVVGAIGGLFVNELPDDELARYRAAVEAVTVADVQAAALAYVHPERLAIVVVGDADRIEDELAAADFGPLEVVREEATGQGEQA